MRRLSVLAALLLAVHAPRADAQAQPSPAPQPCALAGADSSRAAGTTGDAAGADVVIRASVQIDELRFNAQPNARLAVPGCAPGEGLRVVERRNLPSQVQPGVTYRDVYVAVEIVGRLNAACIAALAGDSTALRGMQPGACTPSPIRADGTRSPPPR
jgi:hypothetical protein